MSDHNEIQIPEVGDTGEFFVSYEMLVNAPTNVMKELGLRLEARAAGIPGGFLFTVVEKLDGYLIKWEPHPDPDTTIEDPIAFYLVERQKEL